MASRVENKDFMNYLSEAKSWETDKVMQLQESTKKAWWVASGAGAIAAISVITVAILGPQKTAVPYLLRVDNVTGNMDLVQSLKDGQTSYGEVLNKFHLQNYVKWREGYSRYTIADYYKNVAYMSSPKIQQQYAAYIDKSNPESPFVKYGKGLYEVTINVKSITFLREGISLVRYSKSITNDQGRSEGITHWMATIAYTYANTPQEESVRAINPLGFQVLEYRVDADQTVGEEHANNLGDMPKVIDPPTPLSNLH